MARYQSNRASCGPAALHNALAALGVERTEDELIRLTGQTAAGTGTRGMIKAIRAIESPEHTMVGEAYRWRGERLAKVSLWYHLSEQGRPVILCVDNLDHWVAAVGHLGARYIVIDSAEVGLVFHYDWEALGRRWAQEDNYYGIVV